MPGPHKCPDCGALHREGCPFDDGSKADLLEALKALAECYDEQVEQRYCICGSNDAGEHSTQCRRSMKAMSATRAAIAAVEERT